MRDLGADPTLPFYLPPPLPLHPRQSTTTTPAINRPFVGGSSGRTEKELFPLLLLLLLLLVLLLVLLSYSHTFEEPVQETIHLTQDKEPSFQNSCLSLHLTVLLPNHHNQKKKKSVPHLQLELSLLYSACFLRVGC